jgi:hypothetical protein
MIYSFSIRNRDGSLQEDLGSTDLLCDDAALAFGRDVIGDITYDNPDHPHTGDKMDVVEGGRAVCSIPFP